MGREVESITERSAVSLSLRGQHPCQRTVKYVPGG